MPGYGQVQEDHIDALHKAGITHLRVPVGSPGGRAKLRLEVEAVISTTLQSGLNTQQAY